MKNEKLKIKNLFLLTFLFLFLVPGLAQAGLVPCGRLYDDPNTPDINESLPCTFCHFFLMINNIVRFLLFTILPPLVVLLLVVGGFLFLFAGASADAFNRAKGVIFSTVLGLVIILSAWLIVNTLLVQIGVIKIPELLQWYDIRCPL